MSIEIVTQKEAVPAFQPEVVHPFEEFTIAYGGFGIPVTNEDLIKKFPEDAEAIIGTGMTVRHHPPEDKIGTFVDNKAAVGEEMITTGSMTTQECLRANKWNGEDIDAFFVTSSAPPDDKGEWAKDIARRCGMNPDITKTYYLACASAAVALLDALKNPNLQGKKIIITAVEALGHLIDPQNSTDRATFGNGAASIAFRPGINIKVLAGKTVIIPDTEGVICSPYCYNALELKPDALPDYYERRGGSERVFVYSQQGVHLNLPLSKSGRSLEMRGIETAHLFKHIVPLAIEDVCLPFVNQIDLCVSHQPSAPVIRHIVRLITKIKKSLPNLRIPWVMDSAKMGNVSSATTLISFAELLKQGKIPLNKEFNITSYGVGSAITSMVVRLNSNLSQGELKQAI